VDPRRLEVENCEAGHGAPSNNPRRYVRHPSSVVCRAFAFDARCKRVSCIDQESHRGVDLLSAL
jgi:hypothetical protein